MSVDIRYVTNGTIKGYYVRNAMDETINFYDSIDKVPESLRSRAEKKALTYWGPDISGLMGIRNVLYPDFPKCYHPDYAGETCVAESCRYSPNGDWTLCPYFNGGGEEMINLREDTSLIVCAVRYALGRESYISHTVPAEVKLILPQVTDGILAALRNDVSDWLVHHQDNWTAKDWERLYGAVVKEQEKRKKTNGRNNTKGNNGPTLR